MDSRRTSWWSTTTHRISVMLGRGPAHDDALPSTTMASADDDKLHWLHRVNADPLVRDVIREHYGRRGDGQHVEFLMACSSFDNARNPLQRFEQFRNIIHKFVHRGAERTVTLPDRIREQLLHEWSRWAHGNRLPVGLRLPALEAAAASVRGVVAAQRRA